MTIDVVVAGVATPALVSQQLNTGLGGLDLALGSWAPAFNLGNTALPAAPGMLGDVFGLAALFSNITFPSVASATSFTNLALSLQGLGFTVTNIAGGVSGIPAPAGGESLRASFPLSLPNLQQAAAFNGPTFNFASPQLFTGLSDSATPAPTATPPWLGNLGFNFSLGVDSAGFFLALDSTISLRITGNASLGGNANVAGSATPLSGNAAVDLTIALLLQAPNGKLRVADFSAALGTLFRPSATGTASINFGFNLPVGGFDYRSSYSLAASPTTLATITTTQTLTGTLSLPGLFATGASTPAQFVVTGSFNAATSTWTVTGSAAPGATFTFGGFNLTNPTFTLTLSGTMR